MRSDINIVNFVLIFSNLYIHFSSRLISSGVFRPHPEIMLWEIEMAHRHLYKASARKFKRKRGRLFLRRLQIILLNIWMFNCIYNNFSFNATYRIDRLSIYIYNAIKVMTKVTKLVSEQVHTVLIEGETHEYQIVPQFSSTLRLELYFWQDLSTKEGKIRIFSHLLRYLI